jgi:hypothetical protein
VLYISGVNFNRRACACISFPGQRWLRFLVRGTKPGNSIMTAVDQGGQSVARYRLNGHRTRGRKIVEVAVHPECALTDEMTAAIAIAAPWLRSYYAAPREGGG